MELNPKSKPSQTWSKQSDAIGNLYRSALFMVKGHVNLSLIFLEKARLALGEKMSASLLEELNKEKITKEKQLLWAEKILDQYHILKRLKF